jgi:RNA polymerase sigma-70 factor (ECF subfamily)
LQQNDDLQLASDLLARKPEAFDQFVDAYHSKLFQYAYLMCGHREDAEEVSQETLLQVFRSLSQLRDPARLKPWVFRIARNACLMKRRKSTFAPQRELSLTDYLPARTGPDEKQIDIADWSNLPEDVLLRSEFRTAVTNAIAHLPEMYRSVLLLRDVEGLKTDETADVLELSVDTVKQRLHRARLAIRSELDRYLKNGGIPAHGNKYSLA